MKAIHPSRGDVAMMHKEYSGKYALVRYRGGAEGEEILEDYSKGDPIGIIIGGGQVPKGIEEAFYDMEIGEKRTVVIPCDQAYGNHDPEGVQRYTRSFIKNGDKLEVGVIFAWEHPVTHKPVPVKCIEATENTVTIDFNHLLAGKNLKYWLELVDVLDDNGASIKK
ncbi:MAG: peptidylprolyl isomerase [Actinobacteria bacterium]|nr:peptidylprolyl isomerase [Actinomycetota bacterium]